jgi:hypothetical protein
MNTEITIALGELPLLVEKEELTLEKLDFLLGFRDREMNRIQELCETWQLPYRFATSSGVRVNPNNSYEADAVTLSPGRILVLVECEPREFVGDVGLIRRIDHHRPIDRGYHMPPELYWQASSLGQFYALLGLGLPTKEDLVIAARDHCLFAAMEGKCSGVTPQEAERYGQQSFAKENGVYLSEVQKRMGEMTTAIQASPTVLIGKQEAIDFRHFSTGIANSLDDLIAKQIFANRGQAGLIRCKNQPQDPDKVMMCGATPEAIEDFRTSWGPKQGLSNFFYVVTRRYVGGFDVR